MAELVSPPPAEQQQQRVLLIAVDDSDDSARAFAWALEQLHRAGDQLHLVHVVPRLAFAAQYGVPPVDFVPAAESSAYESAVQRAEQFIIDRFLRALPAAIRAPVVHIVKSEVDTESVGHVLCKKAEELDTAAIVMASHNKGRVAEFFLGSVSQYCTHHSKRPVVIVPAK
ncbi:PHOS34 [Scenedesmus sp. PABB004]|nr:PHOS34 [Scenedesmus sp. PABB004]